MVDGLSRKSDATRLLVPSLLRLKADGASPVAWANLTWRLFLFSPLFFLSLVAGCTFCIRADCADPRTVVTYLDSSPSINSTEEFFSGSKVASSGRNPALSCIRVHR